MSEHNAHTDSPWALWTNPTHVNATEFIDQASSLLEAAVEATAHNSRLSRLEVRQLLVDGLAQSLSTEGPLSVIHLDTRSDLVGARQAFRVHAERANELIVKAVANSSRGHEAGATVNPEFLSHCVGYIWTEPVARLLLGPTGTNVARNYYNEWLWQLVALRDALIPFSRPDIVKVLVDASGLRRLEPTRDRFVLELTSRRISFETLFAHVATIIGADGPPPKGAYGIHKAGIAALPAFLIERNVVASPWAFDIIDPSPIIDDGFVVATPPKDWVSLETSKHSAATVIDPIPAELVGKDQQLTLDIEINGSRQQIDAGAIVTGYRRALRPAGGLHGGIKAQEVDANEVLALGSAVRTNNHLIAIPTGGQWPLVAALLGRVTPGHAVLWRGEDIEPLASATTHDTGLVLIDLRPQ